MNRAVLVALLGVCVFAPIHPEPASTRLASGGFPMPITNQISNPSFETDTDGWTAAGGTLARTMIGDPNSRVDGRYVATLTTDRSGSMMRGSYRVAARSAALRHYQASMFVRRSVGTGGTATVRLVEVGPGAVVTLLAAAQVDLTRRFQGVTLSGTAVYKGDVLRLDIVQSHARQTEALQFDAATVAPAPPALGLIALDDTQMDFANLGDVWRYDYVVVQFNQNGHNHQVQARNLVDQIHAAVQMHSADTKVLAYENVASMGTADPCASDPVHVLNHFGVDYCYADAEHGESSGDDWFLHQVGVDGSPGPRLTFFSYPNNVYADVGSVSYQNQWATDVIARVADEGFDGVYLDDVNTYPGGHRNGQVYEYPPVRAGCSDPSGYGNCDVAYGSAMTSFIANVGDQLHGHGLLTVANVASNLDSEQPYQHADVLSMAGHLDVISREFWTHFGNNEVIDCADVDYQSLFDENSIARRHDYATAINTAGAHFAGLDYSADVDDTARMTYGRAAFLLDWDGTPGSAYFNRTCPHTDPASTAWTTSLGLPSEQGYTDTSGLFSRRYVAGCVRGLVLLNTNASGTSYALDGAYTSELGHPKRATITVPARTGYLLKQAACTLPS